MSAAPEEFGLLETEASNPLTADLDRLPVSDLIDRLHSVNFGVAQAVQQALPQVSEAVQILVDRLSRGGRLIYVGAGTSGRLGVLDASECPPTFGVDAEMVQGVIAGGVRALWDSAEGGEDDVAAGARDLRARDICADDVVVGIAASGRTPYVAAALDAARAAGAATVAVVNVSRSALSLHADVTIAAVTGAEALTGSTRLKAGTAQKMILNLLTTAAMVQLGKVYGNLMVDVRATNAKLRERAVRIVMAASDSEHAVAEAALRQAEGSVRTAIVMLRRGVSAVEAERCLAAAHGSVRAAIDSAAS